MSTMLARNWWVLAVRGLFAVIFGVLAFIFPRLTIATLVLLFGAYSFIDGIFAVIAGIRQYGERERWWAVLLEGIAGIVIGVITFIAPGITAFALLYLIAVWAIVTGVLEIMAAIRLRKEITGEWLLGLSGVASILFGLLLVVLPGAGALTLVWLIGSYAVIFDILLIILGFRLRGTNDATSRRRTAAV